MEVLHMPNLIIMDCRLEEEGVLVGIVIRLPVWVLEKIYTQV